MLHASHASLSLFFLLLLLLKWKKNSFSYWLFILPSSVYFILNTGGTWYLVLPVPGYLENDDGKKMGK
jgi:hypothetical protein